jgi:hypothetical protein
MKSAFQAILIGVFIFSIIIAVLVFSGAIPTPGGKTEAEKITGSVMIWGVLPQQEMNDLIDSLTENHNEYVEKQGVRIAETTNDAFTMSFLQTLFEGFADGFISPKQYTPFHYEKNYNLNAEIIIFNPEKSQIIQLQNIPKKRYAMPIDEIYSTSTKKIHIGTPIYSYDFSLSEGLYNKNKHIGGTADTTNNTSNSIEHFPCMEQINMCFDNDPIIQEQWKKGHDAGLYWRNIKSWRLFLRKCS